MTTYTCIRSLLTDRLLSGTGGCSGSQGPRSRRIRSLLVPGSVLLILRKRVKQTSRGPPIAIWVAYCLCWAAVRKECMIYLSQGQPQGSIYIGIGRGSNKRIRVMGAINGEWVERVKDASDRVSPMLPWSTSLYLSLPYISCIVLHRHDISMACHGIVYLYIA